MSEDFSLVKKLREKTGISILKCKEALEKCNYDVEESIIYLRKQGSLSAAKRADRSTGEGYIGIHSDDISIAMVEINCETDFVAKTSSLIDFANDLAKICFENSYDLESLLKHKLQSGSTVEDERANLVQKTGENIQIKRAKKFDGASDQSIGYYAHINNKAVSVVFLSKHGHNQLAKDIAVNVVAFSPSYTSSDQVPSEILETEKDIARSQIKDKPDHIVEKIVEGKLKDFFSRVCLEDITSVQDSKKTISAHLKDAGNLKIVSFSCWRLLEN